MLPSLGDFRDDILRDEIGARKKRSGDEKRCTIADEEVLGSLIE